MLFKHIFVCTLKYKFRSARKREKERKKWANPVTVYKVITCRSSSKKTQMRIPTTVTSVPEVSHQFIGKMKKKLLFKSHQFGGGGT